jgi:hypothetical protein
MRKKTTTKSVEATIETQNEVEPGKVAETSQQQQQRFRDDEHSTRKWTHVALFLIIVSWLGLTAIILFLQGCPHDCFDFSLTDSVMIAFLSTSLGTVLGLWGIALGYYYFHK